MIPLGEERVQAFDRIINNGKQGGCLINTLGELESFWPEGPRSSKADWLAAALERDLKSDSVFERAREFARDIVTAARAMK